MNAEQILKSHGLKNTGCRKCIVSELLSSDVAMTENEIKDVLPDLFDRVTFYRSLKVLEENEIIHRVILHDATVKYALDDKLRLSRVHPHFHCTSCDKVTCLGSEVENPVVLPSGYRLQSTQILLEGICPECASAAKK